MSENPTDQALPLTIPITVKPITRYWFNQLTRRGLTVGKGEISGHDFKSVLQYLPADTLYFRYQLLDLKTAILEGEEFSCTSEVTQRSGKHFLKGSVLPYLEFIEKCPKSNKENLNPEGKVFFYTTPYPLTKYADLFYEEFREGRDVLMDQPSRI